MRPAVTPPRDPGPMHEPGYDLARDLRRRDAQHWDRPHQRILNALPIPPRAHQVSIVVPVVADLYWSDDGHQRIETTAYAWCPLPPASVHVQLSDARYELRGVWLPPWDVRGVEGQWVQSGAG